MKLIEMFPPTGGDSVHVRPDRVAVMEHRGWTKEPPKKSGKRNQTPKAEDSVNDDA